MKMQELIGEFRKEMPELAEAAEKSWVSLEAVKALVSDFAKCSSQVAKDQLAGSILCGLTALADAHGAVFSGVRRLAELNAGYTRVLGPRKPRAEGPCQMKLGFMEGEEE